MIFRKHNVQENAYSCTENRWLSKKYLDESNIINLHIDIFCTLKIGWLFHMESKWIFIMK